MSDLFTLWLHLLGLAVYFGSGVTLVVVLLPMAAQIPAPREKQRFLAQGSSATTLSASVPWE